jgi:hypothetical protein
MNDKGLNLEEYLDHSRWAMNNGIVSDNVKNQLFVYGSIVHKEIQAVELFLDQDKKTVQYTLYVEKALLEKINNYNILSKSTSLFRMWRFKRLLQKEGSLDFQQILNNFVKDFCGPKWNATVNVVDFNTYVESLGDDSGTDGIS